MAHKSSCVATAERATIAPDGEVYELLLKSLYGNFFASRDAIAAFTITPTRFALIL